MLSPSSNTKLYSDRLCGLPCNLTNNPYLDSISWNGNKLPDNIITCSFNDTLTDSQLDNNFKDNSVNQMRSHFVLNASDFRD